MTTPSSTASQSRGRSCQRPYRGAAEHHHDWCVDDVGRYKSKAGFFKITGELTEALGSGATEQVFAYADNSMSTELLQTVGQ